MNILITGAEGFIGKNLQVRLRELGVNFSCFNKSSHISTLKSLISQSDFIFHLAGVNRTNDNSHFKINNEDLTELICKEILASGKRINVLFASSTHAGLNNPYGISKLNAEQHLQKIIDNGSKFFIYRLPNVFGKWSRPNYNSVVATFCFNISNSLPIKVDDPDVIIRLSYIDDVIDDFLLVMNKYKEIDSFIKTPGYEEIKLGRLAKLIQSFDEHDSVPKVGCGILRQLYATYLSFKTPGNFAYKLREHKDYRGRFVEFLKTEDSGQFSYFTAMPNVTRGGHYHHTKNEKFLVVKGTALFRFINLNSGEKYSLKVDAIDANVVESIPGWVHDVTNVGDGEMIVLLWASELFDRSQPDTITYKVNDEKT
jgi:UDP-2-acetamido-2,6-beta-L-arabino-hexul-4-ose reductase